MTPTSLRTEIHQLLQQGADRKLLRGDATQAETLLRKAYKLAKGDPSLARPWRPLVAYRLAHLLTRRARTGEELEEVEALFQEAAREPALGPLPRIFQLALLGRLERAGRTDHKRLARAFEVAVQRCSTQGRGDEDTDETSLSLSRPLQDPTFNLLEFAAYAFGLDYSHLEGRGTSTPDRFLEGGWCLVGPSPEMAKIRYAESLARAELDHRRCLDSDAVCFVLPEPDEIRWTRGDSPWRRIPQVKTAVMLYALLGRSFRTLDAFVNFVAGDSPDDSSTRQQSRFRQIKARAARDLSEITGRSHEDIFRSESPASIPELSPDVQVYGVVERSYANRFARS